MAAKSNDVPSVPVPPAGSAVPPVEPTPTVAVPPVEPTPTVAVPPVVPAPAAPPPPADPYVAAAPVVNPPPGYSAPGTGYAAPAAYGAPGAYAAPPANGLSITSMITGIVGVLSSFFGLGLLPSIAAVITGHMGQKRQPYAKAFWLTGIITGYVGLGITILTAVVFLVALIGSLAVGGALLG